MKTKAQLLDEFQKIREDELKKTLQRLERSIEREQQALIEKKHEFKVLKDYLENNHDFDGVERRRAIRISPAYIDITCNPKRVISIQSVIVSDNLKLIFKEKSVGYIFPKEKSKLMEFIHENLGDADFIVLFDKEIESYVTNAFKKKYRCGIISECGGVYNGRDIYVEKIKGSGSRKKFD